MRTSASERDPGERVTHTSKLARVSSALLIALFVASCGKKSVTNNAEPTNASLPEGTAVSLALSPGTLLLPGVGESAALEPVFVDEDGGQVRGDATFATSDGDVVEVADDGTITARAIGSARITASSGELSATATVYVARPADGVVLIDASQVVDGPYATNEDPTSLDYGVTLSDVSLSEGDLLWATDDIPVTGRVVSVDEGRDGIEVVLELAPIDELFEELEFTESFDLDDPELFRLNPELEANYEVAQNGGELVLTPKSTFVPGGLGAPMGTVAIQPFGCETDLSVGSFPITQNGAPSFSLTRSIGPFEIDYNSLTGLRRMAMSGYVEAKVEVKPQITAEVEAKLTCSFPLGQIIIPIGGPLSFFFGGSIPLGVGFELNAKLTGFSFGFEMTAQKRADFTLGIDCTSGECLPIEPAVMTQPGMTDAKLILPDPTQQFRAEMGLFAYGFANLAFGPPFLQALQFEPFSFKAGAKQSANLAPASVQFADTMYASDYKLEVLAEFGTTLQLEGFLGLLDINLATFKLTTSLPISSSPSSPLGPDNMPANPLTVPATAAPGTAMEGTVELDPEHLTYLGIDNVTAIIVMRDTINGLEEVARVAGVSGQASYPFEWTPGMEHVGAQTLVAFVETTLSGPFLLELGKNAQRTVMVAERGAILLSGTDLNTSYGEIFAVDPETLETTRLTTDDGPDQNPRWSSDRSEIFFVSNRTGSFRLHRMNADGSNPRPVLPVLTDEPTSYDEWAIAPDGSKIAYISEDDVWVAPLAGGAAINLSNGMDVTEYGGVAWPFWSPDSADVSFAFVAFDDNWIGIASASGGGAASTLTASDNDVEPHWNENREILGAEWQSPNNVELYIATPGGARTRLLTGYADYELYRWMPGGEQVVFVGYDPSFLPVLYLTDRSGQVDELHAGFDRISNVAPSPDGRSVAVAGRIGTRTSVWVIDTTTMTAIDIAPDLDTAIEVDW